ncbi:MAG: EamA family transporter [Clostridia bacterium]|nr:EamA family transporter [Clostridia bacterium]
MKNKFKIISLSLLVMALWGSLFPMIKIGYASFNIDSASIPDILMFASMRFILSGIVVCAFSFFRKEKLAAPKAKSILNILVIGLVSIVLHYAFTYIGLSVTDGSKTALIKQIGSLIYVCVAFLFFKEEKFSVLKIIGAIIGFLGIIAINYSGEGVSFTLGDMLIILASICTVVSSVLVKKTAGGSSSFWITGISQLSGGIILFVAALIMGGNFLGFNLQSTLVFAYICFASIVAYTLWYYILKTSDLSNMFIIKFAEPLFACVFGAVLLGENIFKIQYLLAFVLISAGIILGNKSVTKNESNN